MSSVQQGQYLSVDTLLHLDVAGDYDQIGTDTYNEGEIMKSILSVNPKECFSVALQFAIVGMGNKNYGNVMIDGKQHKVSDLATKNKIKLSNKLNDKLQPGDLTMKRLSRFFRFHIHNYLKQTGKSSYLFRKYCNDNNALPEYVFPGAEHMVEENNAIILINAYKNVDEKLSTSFVARVNNVYNARGLKNITTQNKIQQHK